jgi:hypothetical protein
MTVRPLNRWSKRFFYRTNFAIRAEVSQRKSWVGSQEVRRWSEFGVATESGNGCFTETLHTTFEGVRMLLSLETEHRRIREIASRIGDLLGSAESFDQKFAAPMRWEFARMLMQHMSYKEAMIYGPLLRACGPAERPELDRLRALCRELYEDYKTHMSIWTDGEIQDDWQGYRVSVLDLIVRLNQAIELERRFVYPCLRSNMIPAAEASV